ncbi:hypothetical protein DFH09DRAFT_1375247 [Mycena vulgaris]|nr:hypothetical protein DFH09DRAFT_1375247 [Mycena vulgaris]
MCRTCRARSRTVRRLWRPTAPEAKITKRIRGSECEIIPTTLQGRAKIWPDLEEVVLRGCFRELTVLLPIVVCYFVRCCVSMNSQNRRHGR